MIGWGFFFHFINKMFHFPSPKWGFYPNFLPLTPHFEFKTLGKASQIIHDVFSGTLHSWELHPLISLLFMGQIQWFVMHFSCFGKRKIMISFWMDLSWYFIIYDIHSFAFHVSNKICWRNLSKIPIFGG